MQHMLLETAHWGTPKSDQPFALHTDICKLHLAQSSKYMQTIFPTDLVYILTFD